MIGNADRQSPLRRQEFFVYGGDYIWMLVNALLIAIIFGSCSSNTTPLHSVVISTVDPIVFQIGFPIMPNQCGTLEDSQTGERTFYFANTATWRTLKRFNDKGVLVQSVPLTKAMDSLGTAGGVFMTNRDTILVFSVHGESYAIIDKTGDVLKIHHLNDQLVDSLGFEYELMTASLGRFALTREILFRAYCIGKRMDADKTKEKPEADEQVAGFSSASHGAHLALLRDYRIAPKITYTEYEFYYHRTGREETTPRLWVEAPQYSCIGDKFYLYSAYSSWIYCFDKRLLVDSIQVNSLHGPTHIELPPLVESLRRGNDYFNTYNNTKGQIVAVIPIPFSDALLVQVMAEVPEDSDAEQRLNRDWSYMVYNKYGKQLCETRFPGAEHEGFFVLWNKYQVWVKRSSSPKEIREGTFYFDRMTITG